MAPERSARPAVNGTPDGTYHTARALPELRASGLGALDGALWNPWGVWAVAPFLREPQRYGLRWVFSNHREYEPVLRATGWTYRFDVGAVKAWERADVQPQPTAPPPENVWAARWWGSAPLVTLALAALALAWPSRSRPHGEQTARQKSGPERYFTQPRPGRG